MRVKAESKIMTFGDLKEAVAAFESQGFKDTDLVNPPSAYLPPESKETQDALPQNFRALAKSLQAGNVVPKSTGLVLYMVRDIGK